VGRRPSLAWLGLLPFFGYVGVFFLLPTGVLLWTAFQSGTTGGYTTGNLYASVQGAYGNGLKHSVVISAGGGTPCWRRRWGWSLRRRSSPAAAAASGGW